MSAAPSRTAKAALVLALPALALTACGGGDEAASTGEAVELDSPTPSSEPTATASSTEAPEDPTTSGAPAGAPGEGAGPEGMPPRPERDRCVDVPEAPDGLYTVYEAGTAAVLRDGEHLALGEVTPAQGWTHRVDSAEADEVEIDFRRDGQDVLDLEVEIDDGGVTVEICADDD